MRDDSDGRFRYTAGRREFIQKLAASTAGFLGATSIRSMASEVFSTSSSGSNTGQFRCISHVYTLANVYWSNWEKGAAEAAKALKMELQVEVDGQNNDKLQTIFRTARSRGFRGITSVVADPGVTPNLLAQAQKEELYVANGWNLAPWTTPFEVGDYFYSFSTPNDVAGAYELAKILFEKMEKKGELIHIAGIPGSTVAINRQLGLDQALKEYPEIKLVARQPGGDNRGTTIPVINALLTANPRVKAVFCHNDDTAMGSIAALQSRGMNAVLVTGIDAIPDMLDAIKSGRAFATWAHHGAYMGARVTVQIFDALSGVKPSASERMMWSGGFVINTSAAAVAYKDTMFGAGGFPYDFALMSKALHPNDWDPQNTVAPMDFEQYFSRQSVRPAHYVTPQAYAAAVQSGEVQSITKLYRDHFRKDPLSNIRKLCVNGGKDIV